MINSRLFDETTFYTQFKKDLLRATHEVVIECPFITTRRAFSLNRELKSLIYKGIPTYVITRDPSLHTEVMAQQAEEVIRYFEHIGVQVFVTANRHHRKLAIIDREILWEGSLNILSHNESREVMRRTASNRLSQEMIAFLNLSRFINQDYNNVI